LVVVPQAIDGLIIGLALALVALGLTMIFGLLGVINLAHGELYMLGAYAAFSLTAVGIGFWGALFVAPLIVGAVGGALERFGLRRLGARHDYAILSILLTFGASLILRDLVQFAWGPETHQVEAPIAGIVRAAGMILPAYRMLILGIAALLIVGTWLLLYRSPLGAVLRAAAYDRQMVASLGIPVSAVLTGTFVFGSLLAGTSGVLLSPIYAVFPTMGHDFMLLAFAAVIVGGMGSVSGAVLASILLAEVQSIASLWISPVWAESMVFVVMFLVLVFRPQGLYGRLGAA